MPKKYNPSIKRALQRYSHTRKRSFTISVIVKKQLAASPKRGGRKKKRLNKSLLRCM